MGPVFLQAVSRYHGTGGPVQALLRPPETLALPQLSADRRCRLRCLPRSAVCVQPHSKLCYAQREGH
jgi:hypothetical protein